MGSGTQEEQAVSVNTNNGVERQNLAVKYDFLTKKRSANLGGMITILVEEFLPENYKKKRF